MSASHQTSSRKYVIGVDIGTTNIKCCAYDRYANVIGKAESEITSLTNQDGMFEIIPDVLWDTFVAIVKRCLSASSLQAHQISSMGIATQRGTFLTWDRETGQPFHNFISWKDKTAKKLCNRWNSSFLMKILQFGALLLYGLTFITKFQVFSKVKFSPAMVLPRLYLILEKDAEFRQRCKQNMVFFGTIDTWLLWKATGRKSHFTDSSNACITGFFDHFEMKWSSWILRIFNIPMSILPEVKNTCDMFGDISESIFGSAIPVCSLVGDQQASMFGAGCFQKYDINCTMGTGSFLTINTGDKPSFMYPGLFPFVGWTIKSKTTYIAECGVHNIGPAVKWMQSLGFISHPSESTAIAHSVKGTRGVYFVPTECPQKASDEGKFTFVNMDLKVKKEHLVRSVLESFAFQVVLLFDLLNKMFGKRKNIVKVCGGVSRNDFVVQLVSDITAQRFERLQFETACLGAALLAGLHIGFWKSVEDISEIGRVNDVFVPNTSVEDKLELFRKWKSILSARSFKNC